MAGYLSLLGDIQKVVPCSDADKPVGSCGAWRGVCYKQRETSVYMLLPTHIHTELIVEFDALIIIICVFYSLQDNIYLSVELSAKSSGQRY